MLILIILFLILVALAGFGYQEVKQNTIWVPMFRGKRLGFYLSEGPVWLLRKVFSKITIDTREKPVVILEKRKEFIEPNEDVESHEAPHQVEETILTPDGNGDGAAMVRVSNVVAFYHPIRDEQVAARGLLKLLQLLGWHRGTALLKFTSIAIQTIESRLTDVVLKHLRLIIANYPYQLTTNLNLKIGDKLPSVQERYAIRQKIDADLLAAVNADVSTWGIVVTSIPIGDIDPDPVIVQALQGLSAAGLQKEQAVIKTTALVEQAKLVHAAGNDPNPTIDGIRATVDMFLQRENEHVAAEKGGNADRLVQNLVGTADRLARV